MTDGKAHVGAVRLTATVIFVAIALALAAGGFAYYRVQTEGIRHERYQHLHAVGELKSEQITAWRRERRADVGRLAQGPFLTAAIENLVRDPGNEQVQYGLRRRFELERQAYGYVDVLLCAPEGRVLFSLSGGPSGPLHPEAQLALETALASGNPVLSDLYRDASADICIDAIAPVRELAGRTLAVVVLRSDAADSFFPMVQSWPVPSESAEVLLARREGDDAVLSSILRHRPDPALSVRFPLSRLDIPAVRAVLGEEGLFDGFDYRGVRVLADLRAIPGTPWWMVAKMDASEILAEARYRALMIGLVVLIGILFAAALTSYAFRLRQARVYRALYRSEQAAQAALRESERTLSTLMANLPGMVYRCRIDNDWTMRFVSEGAFDVTGYRPAELVDNARLAYADLIHPEDRERVWEVIEHAVQESRPFTLEYRIIHESGEEKWVWERGRAIPPGGGAEPVLEGVITDITERKRAEQAREHLEGQLRQAQKMEAVGRLAGGVAHDFNNMLGVILGRTELALMCLEEDNPARADLLEVQSAAERSAELVRQLLGFARKQVVAPKVLDLNDTVSGMLKMLGRLIGEDIDLAWLPGHGLWPVKMDPGQVHQILANLVVNARDAIEGGGRVTIETANAVFNESYCHTHAGFLPGEYAMLAVSDSGCGMDSETLDKLFEPFFTTKAFGQGTGLGLATVYGVVKQSDGFINVYSEPGHGATFRIYFPRHAGEGYEPAATGESAAIRGGDETVLLVEDEDALRELARRMLEDLGYTVIAAEGPAAALDLARRHESEIHLLMTDVVMPGMNGRELGRRLKELRPALKCLFMSGYTANVIAHHGILDAGVHYLQKPFSREALAARLREALE